MTHTVAKKVKVKGFKKRVETNRRTDTTDRIIFPTKRGW